MENRSTDQNQIMKNFQFERCQKKYENNNFFWTLLP